MNIDPAKFRAHEGRNVQLSDWPTAIKPFYKSKKDYEKILGNHSENMIARQGILYAHNRYSLLLIFQALDAGGKDSAIKHVMSGLNPQGCQVHSFKEPSSIELQHDFLWRTHRGLPERGHIGIFNRSYYEEVLVVRVHPDILRKQDLPSENEKDPKIWRHRYDSINDFEKHLHRNGTHIVKFFLHISKEEQRSRFLARLNDPEKNWKIVDSDLKERERWKDYQHAYEECISATSTKRAPWHIVPADDKKNARLIVSQVITDTLDDLKMSYPKPDKTRRKELDSIREVLKKSGD